MSRQKSTFFGLQDPPRSGDKSIFGCDSFYEAADTFLDQIPPFHVRKEGRYKPDEYKRGKLPVLHVPFIEDPSVAVTYFVRQSLSVIGGISCGTDPCLFPIVLGLQCFELDDVSERRRMFDLQFSKREKCDDRTVSGVRNELQAIEARRDSFKRLAEKLSRDYSYPEADESVFARRMELFEECAGSTLSPDKKLASQLRILEMNLYGIKLRAPPKRNDWALDESDLVVRGQLLELLEFAASLSKQPAKEAAKYICMWSTLLFRLISRSVSSVEVAMKNFANLYVSITGVATTIKSYSLPLNVNFLDRTVEHYGSTVLLAGLEILNQADNSKAMELLKRSRKLCYVDTLKYSGMDAVRLAFETASELQITVENLLHKLLEGVDPAEYSNGRLCGIRHTCHLLKLLLRDFSNFDSCDSWMYARVLDDRYFASLANDFHGEFIYFCYHIFDAVELPGLGIWATRHLGTYPHVDEAMLHLALSFRRMFNPR